MTTLENLYYGNIFPADKDLKRGSKYARLLNQSVQHEEKLIPTFSKEQASIFEKYRVCVTEMNSISEKEAFIQGMKLGIKIIVEVFIDDSKNFTDG